MFWPFGAAESALPDSADSAEAEDDPVAADVLLAAAGLPGVAPEFATPGFAGPLAGEPAGAFAAVPVLPAAAELPGVEPEPPGVEPELGALGAAGLGFAEPPAREAAAVLALPGAGIGRVGAAGEGCCAAAGLRSVVASGRASAPAGVAGSALSRAGFLSSFGSDTHYPSLRRNS
ncbi:hypothetical protein OG203_27510 [Nocardia sp. NBC_01499]|uniref:hypothetical protein n=1 Tax=Nocardia sp. NBC_01499 TaxID=2903597 RepID=UPI00386FC8E1